MKISLVNARDDHYFSVLTSKVVFEGGFAQAAGPFILTLPQNEAKTLELRKLAPCGRFKQPEFDYLKMSVLDVKVGLDTLTHQKTIRLPKMAVRGH